ncbi:sporulation protein YqfD [Dysosmobacter sp.]|uniref:sporulation protein YqfD n=1 Tax=Dysosmobacter sp. TaxID=2591382 RepID=UPI003AF1C554
MLKELINRARGQVWLRVTCPYPERVLNLCSARKLAFWDLEWEGAETFTCRMSRRDHRILSRAAEKLDCTIEIVRREGAPYTLAKLRHRQALAVGIAACGTAVLIGSFFVWDIQIAGNETVPREVILRSLEKNGVHRGCFGFALNGEDIRNHVLLEIPELSWVAVNVSGCRANVEVRERRTAPKPLDRKIPCNLVARRDGLVLRVQALGGVPQVLQGMSVTRGQLLISGVEDTAPYGARLTAGLGRVEGRTWYTLTANVPLTEAAKRYTGEEKRLRSLIFGTRRIKFFSNSSIDAGKCDKMTVRTPVCVFGLPLPVTLETETLRFYETEIVACDPAQRQAETGAVLEQYLHSLVDAYGTVTAAQVSSRVRGDVLTVTLSAECREELGTRVPIYTTEEPGGAPG